MLNKILENILNPTVQPISGLDAAFLYSETPKSPMHIAMLTIVEESFAFNDFKKNLANKLHYMPKFRQRLVNVPFNLDFPYWADDPNFDLDLHVQRIKLPDPSDWETLRELTSSIFSSPLDLRRPLWSITFIEGLDAVSQVPKGSVAVLAKVHHVMVDGMSGVGLMGVLFSMTPEEFAPKKPPPPFKPAPLPNELTLLAKSGVDFLKDPLKIPKIASQTVYKVLQSQLKNRIKLQNDLVKSSYSVPRTIFNGSISPKRTWGTAMLSLKRIKVISKTLDVTINDIILGICAGGIRKYLVEKDKLPSQPLVANVPISVRDNSSSNEMNNQISNMLIPIATHIEDPIKRIFTIQEHTNRGKVKHQAMGAKTLAKMAEAVPFGIANLAAGVYSRYNLNEFHRPPFNVTISNIPGPQIPLYLNGHKVLSILGLTPVVDGLGLIIAVFSYNGQVSITSTSDAKTMPDADKFSRYIRESANELEALVLDRAKKQTAKKNKSPKSNPFFTKAQKYFSAHPKWDKKFNGVYQINITETDQATSWQVDLTGESAVINKETPKKSASALTIADNYLYQIHKKELTIAEAQIQGRVKLEGSVKNKAKFIQLFELINDYK